MTMVMANTEIHKGFIDVRDMGLVESALARARSG